MRSQKTSMQSAINLGGRSSLYQWKLLEIPWDNEFMKSYSGEDSLYHEINNQKVKELKDQLWEQINSIAHTGLTKQQTKIWDLLIQGKTQTEIGKILKRNQSTIFKNISGNEYFVKGEQKYVRNGGLIKKLQNLAKADPIIQDILKQIAELAE